MRKGLTFIELMIVIAMLVILTAVLFYVLRTVFLIWPSQVTRAGIDISLDTDIEQIVRDLRKERGVQSASGYNEIRFTQDQSAFYIYYFYHAADPYGPPFDTTLLYQLRKATLAGGMNGTFTYGSGDLVMTDVMAPPTSILSLDNHLITLDLSVKRDGETIRSRTQVRPRNL